MQEKSVGILAYGSLISDLGAEITAATIRIIENVETPFCVEFARSSTSRGGAPTLVPVSRGGSKVSGQIILVNASVDEATDMLYRREIHKVGSGRHYRVPVEDAQDGVQVKTISDMFPGVNTTLYTDIVANIFDLTAERLAFLAIDSVRKAEAGKDGISYLIATQGYGIQTALSNAYAEEILRQTDTPSLEDALRRLRS
jgi:cation transport regulator ChaC